MPSLTELQQRFARAIDVPAENDDVRIGIYRRNIAGNYRNALGATFRVVRALVGAGFFATAADAFVAYCPSRSGDLNVYGAEFPAFLATYPHADSLPYLPDVARLEWAIDECCRAADGAGSVARVVAALAATPADELARRTMRVDSSCRFIHSAYPVLRIWRAHEDGTVDDDTIDLSAGPDHLLVRRVPAGATVERLAPAEFAFLAALARHEPFAEALDAALSIEPAFDLQDALARHIGNETIAGIGPA